MKQFLIEAHQPTSIYSLAHDDQEFQVVPVEGGEGLSQISLSPHSNHFLAHQLVKDKGRLFGGKYHDKQLEKISSSVEDSQGPVHLRFLPGENLALAANEAEGHISLYELNEEGDIILLDRIDHKGAGPEEVQDHPHPCHISFSPDQKYFFVCDWGNDTVYGYEVVKGLVIREISRTVFAPGFGPQQLVFHPHLDIAYITGRLASELTTLSYVPSEAGLDPFINMTSLPEDEEGPNHIQKMLVDQEGRYLYLLNHGHNSLVVYQLHPQAGASQLVGHFDLGGQAGVDMAFNADESQLLILFQDPDRIGIYQVDQGQVSQLTSKDLDWSPRRILPIKTH